MTKTDTRNVSATVAQIHALEEAGCEIVRVAVPDLAAAAALSKIKKSISLPLVADIHFNYRLALEALRNGADGLRINPGNIGGKERVAEIVREARAKGTPLRIGVNAGSLEKEFLKREGVTAQALVASALRWVRFCEDLGFSELKISLKAAQVPLTVEAYRLLAKEVPYPFHLGITEAGTVLSGTVKSAVGLSLLLAEGIGDTLRVSLTGDPCTEIKVGYEILRALGLRQRGVELISCPMCGRCEVDLISLATEIEQRLAHIEYPLKVAVMGCVVNGPGEAKQADVGVALERGEGVIFRKGKIVKKEPLVSLVPAFLAEVTRVLAERQVLF